jgi:hypothetical protein
MTNRKSISVNGREVTVHSETKTDKNRQTAIHLTAIHEGVSLHHVMTIGAENEPLSADYSLKQLQADVDAARQKLAALVESKHRAVDLAKQIV